MTQSINLPDINLTLDLIILLKLSLSIAIGYLLGKERKSHDKSAGGSRTMALVSMTACLIAILTLLISEMNPATFNFSRLMSYGISGMAFMGAGVIWKHKGNVEGLTTAATLWVLLPINYLIGLNFYFIGITSAIFVYLILESKYWRNL